ncbi:MAG: tRNA (adenosine(37)-N6)-dimethylallyltransferase MiaA [Chitinivibrionales bacterium]|nr:tRNA (adenosine(37)-N6)-dimethylallyltransferase MiaA [Chitinivibrionales bacterium]
MQHPVDLLVICGPTASGKTRLAVTIARMLHGEIISADSRQVYRGMDIGTGKDRSEYRTASGCIPCHLIDIADPHDIYTLYHFQKDCYAALDDIHRRGSLPILAGGSGLYIEAVLKKYRIANVPENVELRTRLIRKEKTRLIDQLAALDPGLLQATDTSSRKRIVRAIEVAEYGRNHPVHWGNDNAPQMHPLILATRRQRDDLLARIRLRLHARIKQGMIEEVKQLISAGVTYERLELFGLEYKYIVRFLRQEYSREEMIEQLCTAINRFAKRQMTWFRGMQRRGFTIHWIDNADEQRALSILKQHYPGVNPTPGIS